MNKAFESYIFADSIEPDLILISYTGTHFYDPIVKYLKLQIKWIKPQ